MSVDYAIEIAEEADEKTAPILVADEHKTGSIWAFDVSQKGVDAGTTSDWRVEKLQAAGYGGVTVERAVRNWRDQYRTMRHHVEHIMKKTVPNGSPLSTWLVTWAVDVINKFRVQSNGRTA